MKKLSIFSLVVLAFLGCNDSAPETKTEAVKAEAQSVVAKPAEAPIAKVEEVAKNLKNSATSVIDSMKKEVENTVEAVKEEVTKVTKIDGATLYKTCVSCHGASGEKKALGKSNIIKGQSKKELITKLNGYKDGSYGGAMKGLMVGQVKALSNEKIEALSDYISKL